MKPEKAFRIRLVKILEILRQETDEIILCLRIRLSRNLPNKE